MFASVEAPSHASEIRIDLHVCRSGRHILAGGEVVRGFQEFAISMKIMMAPAGLA